VELPLTGDQVVCLGRDQAAWSGPASMTLIQSWSRPCPGIWYDERRSETIDPLGQIFINCEILLLYSNYTVLNWATRLPDFPRRREI